MRILLALLLSLPAFASLPNTLQWDVRTTGADTNGGAFDPSVASPGTDYSQQNSAQIAYTDLVIGATTTQYTSVLHAVTSAVVGNTIQIISGAGCTTGFFNIRSETASTPNFATVDRSMGTAASVCVANLGGSLLTLAAAAASGAAQSFNVINVKAGTYTITTAITISNPQNQTWTGYNATHGDGGTKPLVTTATTAINMFQNVNGYGTRFVNMSFSVTVSGSSAFYLTGDGEIFVRCLFNFVSGSGAIDVPGVNYLVLYNNEFAGAGTALRFNFGSGTFGQLFAIGNYFHTTGLCIWDVNSSNTPGLWYINNNIFSGCSYGVYKQSNATNYILYLTSNTFYNSTNDGAQINIAGGAGISPPIIGNNICYGNGGYCINFPGGALPFNVPVTLPNGLGSNTLGNYNNWPGVGDVTLTANPFTNAGGGIFTLNATAGGGAALKAAAFPGVTAAGTGYLDIGALQSMGASAGGGNHAYVQ